MTYETKDSGEREEYTSGMVRDTEHGKPRFDLLFPQNVPFQEQILTRFAGLMARGAEKYDARNWEKAESETELARYYSSALRHLIQWLTGETDEDHAVAVMFNIMAAETVKYKMKEKLNASSQSGDQDSPGKESSRQKGGVYATGGPRIQIYGLSPTCSFNCPCDGTCRSGGRGGFAGRVGQPL